MKQELRRMLKLLMRLQCIDETGIVLQKGQIALNFRTADELMLTELVVNGQLQSLSPPQLAALVSCLVQPDGKQPQKKVSQIKSLLKWLFSRFQLRWRMSFVWSRRQQQRSEYWLRNANWLQLWKTMFSNSIHVTWMASMHGVLVPPSMKSSRSQTSTK